jgi:uncharacterized protein DUF4037
MPKFIPGLTLCRLFYNEAVRPILQKQFPRLRYSAALIGWGSEVLGFDDSMSRNHHWGPRVLLFLDSRDHLRLENKIRDVLANALPREFLGYSTSYSEPDASGVRLPLKIVNGPVNHMVQTFTLASFFDARLGFDPSKKIVAVDWLMVPQQRLLEVVSGEIYHDGLGKLRVIREKLNFYPNDVWLYLLAAQWTKISQEEAFVGRTGEIGDELGSRIVAARIVREIMKLAFLMEKQYAPYTKWLGSAFARLKIASKLNPILRDVLTARTWKARERKLAEAYSIVAKQHNKLRVTKPLPVKVTRYYDRPYFVIHGDAFARSIREGIKDPTVRRLPPNIGSIDQFSDNHDLIQRPSLVKRLRAVYESFD